MQNNYGYFHSSKKELGKLKIQRGTFECIGILHERDPKTFEIWTHQRHYVEQLRPMSADAYAGRSKESAVSKQTHGTYMSLLGAIAWLTQTMPAICVYVAYLQRHNHDPRVEHVRSINRLLRWIQKRKKDLGIRYCALKPPARIAVVADSAFKAQETDGLAMRGCALMLIEDREPIATASTNKCVLIDWYARKQSRVVRSTFAAELYSLLDAFGHALVIDMLMTELRSGPLSAAELAKMQDLGRYALPIDVYIDAKAVYDAIAAEVTKPPVDRQMLAPTLAVKEALQRGQLKNLTWIDTRDMLADGLTKGSVDREALIDCGSQNVWKLIGEKPVTITHSVLDDSTQSSFFPRQQPVLPEVPLARLRSCHSRFVP